MFNNGSNNGGFFKNIVNNANNSLNGEKAAKIKKLLITWGAVGTVVGFILIISGFITFISGGFSGMRNMGSGFPTGIIVGMILFMLGGAILSVGIAALGAGIKIVVVGVGAKIVDANDKCPKCGVKIDADNAYCDRCGTPLLKTKLCECGKQNNINSEYCKSCGKKL